MARLQEELYRLMPTDGKPVTPLDLMQKLLKSPETASMAWISDILVALDDMEKDGLVERVDRSLMSISDGYIRRTWI